MAAANTSDYRCGICRVDIRDLVDPGELPCGHVHCTPCMDFALEYKEADVLSFTCPHCQQVYKESDVERSKLVDVESVVDRSGGTTLTCDGEDCEKTAVSFCIDCGDKRCDTHQQSHHEFFAERHKVISIDVYERSPNKYKKVVCDHHQGEPLIKACKQCYKLVGNECDKGEGDCTGLVEQHEHKSSTDAEDEITSNIKKFLKAGDAERIKFFHQNKEARDKVKKIDNQCKEWMQEIERVRDEQIQEIQQQSEKVIQKIVEHLKETVEYGEELTRSSDVELSRSEPGGNVSLIVNAQPTTFNADFIKLPSTLTLSSEHEVGEWCYSASHRESGDVLVAYGKGVKILDRKTGQVRESHLSYEQVQAVVEHENTVYVLYKVDKTCKVDMYLPNLEHAQTLFEFDNPTRSSAYMAVSDRHVAVYILSMFSVVHEFVIYDILSQTRATHSANVHNLSLLPDGKLLVVGVQYLAKYSIDNEQLTEIWTCKRLKNIETVCVDSNGVIYATTHFKLQVLYIISPSGEKLQEIHNDKLPAVSGSISVRGDELALPGYVEGKLFIFKLH